MDLDLKKISVYKSCVNLEINLYVTKFYDRFNIEMNVEKISIGTNGISFESCDCEISYTDFLKLSKLYSCILPILQSIKGGVT